MGRNQSREYLNCKRSRDFKDDRYDSWRDYKKY